MTTRSEHLQWCKKRALESLDFDGSAANAMASMLGDMNEHPETQGHIGLELGIAQMMSGGLSTREQVIEWINGFR